MTRGRSDVAPAVVGVARRTRIDVVAALNATRDIDTDAELANELVRIAIDADEASIVPLLEAVERVKDPLWRARALSGLLGRAPRLAKTLPEAAQERVVLIVASLGDETARGVALTNVDTSLPNKLAKRLAAMSMELGDPLVRLRAMLRWDPQPEELRAARYLDTAQGIEDEGSRADAFALLAPKLTIDQLEQAYAHARRIDDADARALAMLRIADRFEESERRSVAHVEILDVTKAMLSPLRRFDVTVQLRDLSDEQRREVSALVFHLAIQFDEPAIRCRALFMASGYVEDQLLQQRSLLSGLAAAECVWDEKERARLFLLLRPSGPTLAVPVRRELTRAVERLQSDKLKHELYATLGRFFFYERPQAPGVSSEDEGDQWDIFISYSSADLDDARFVASELKSRGVRVFLSADKLDAAIGSVSWTDAIDQALLESRAVLVLLTESALASKWVCEEWRKYYRLIVEVGVGRLLTLRLGGPPINELPLTLRMYQCIESATGKIEPGHLTRIMDIIRGG